MIHSLWVLRIATRFVPGWEYESRDRLLVFGVNNPVS
jgi:hypothetical protein